MKPSDLNTSIISILSDDHPLNLKQIHGKLTQKITYQGVYKALNELTRKGIITKKERLYSLKRRWVKNQMSLYQNTYRNYFHSDYKEKEKIQLLQFENVNKLVEFLDTYLNKFSRPYKVYASVKKIMPFIPESFISLIDKINKNGQIYLACRGDTAADKIAAIYFKSLGLNVKTGASLMHYNSMYIEDEVIQYYFFPTNAYRRMLYTFSDRIKSKTTLNILRKNSELTSKRMKIYLLINKHPILVEDLKKNMLKIF